MVFCAKLQELRVFDIAVIAVKYFIVSGIVVLHFNFLSGGEKRRATAYLRK